jgi:hypothetical protein
MQSDGVDAIAGVQTPPTEAAFGAGVVRLVVRVGTRLTIAA